MKKYILLALFPIVALSQPSGPARAIVTGAALPATCAPGQVFFKTTSSVGAYQCITTNTWQQFASGTATGDVIGPGTNTANFVPQWNGANSKILKDGLGVASANTVSTLVQRDGSGNFSAGTITASLTGHASLDAPVASPTFTGVVTIPNGGVFGTPASITLTNATGLPLIPLTTGVTGILPVANGGTGQQANFSNGQLLIGNTNTGSLSVATLTAGSNVTVTNGPGTITISASGGGGGGSPGGANGDVQCNVTSAFGACAGATDDGVKMILVGPSLGTPVALTLTNGTGLPISTGVSGLAPGMANFLATPSSANLATTLTDETGTSLAVFNTSPLLVTPKVTTITDANGNPFLISSATASAVDSVTITNAATANPATVTIGATGSDSNINLSVVAKGSGGVNFPNGLSSGTSPPSLTAGTGAADAYGEGTVPSVCATSGVDCVYADSTAHKLLASYNNGSYFGLTQTICSGTVSLGTGAISSGAKASTVTGSCTGLLTTDTITADFNADPTSATGYTPSASGMLTIIKFPTADTVNFIVANNTGGSITPSAITLNYRVTR